MYLNMSSSSDELFIVASETDIQRKLRVLARMAEILLARIDNGSYRRQRQLAAIERIRAGDTKRCHTWESTVRTYDERKRPEKNTTFCACCRRKQVPESPHYARCKTPSMNASSAFQSNMLTRHDTSQASIDAPGGCCNQKRSRPEVENEFLSSESSDGVACSDPKCVCKTRESGSQHVIQVISLQHSVKAIQSIAEIGDREINVVEQGVSAQKSMEVALMFPGNSATQSRNLHGSSSKLDGQGREDEEDAVDRKEAGMLENFGSESHIDQAPIFKDELTQVPSKDKSSADTAPEELYLHKNAENSKQISKEQIKSTDPQNKKYPCDCNSDVYYRSSNYHNCKCSPPPQYDSAGNKILPIYEPDAQKAETKLASKARAREHSRKLDESGIHQLSKDDELDQNCACPRKPARVGQCPKKYPYSQDNVIVCGPVKTDEAIPETKLCCPPKMKPARTTTHKKICPPDPVRRSRSPPVYSNSDSPIYCDDNNNHKRNCVCKPHKHAQKEMAYPCYKPKYSPRASPRTCLQKSPCQICVRRPCKNEPVQRLDKTKCQKCNKPKVKCQRCNKPKVYPQRVPECLDNRQRYEKPTTAHSRRRCKRCNQNILPEKLEKRPTCEGRKNHEDEWMRRNRCKCKPHESDNIVGCVKPKDSCKARVVPERCQLRRDAERCNRQIDQRRDEHTCRQKICQDYRSIRPNDSHWTEVKPPSKIFDPVERRHAKCRWCPDREKLNGDHRLRRRK